MRRMPRRRRATRSDQLACRDAVRLMTDYLDGELSAPDAHRLAAHLAGCPHCSEYLRQLRTTIVLAAGSEPEPDGDTIRSLATLYRQWRAEST